MGWLVILQVRGAERMYARWIEQAGKVGVAQVAAALGLKLSRKGWGPCPVCNAEVRSKKNHDRRGPLGVRPDDQGWECQHCHTTGDALNLATLVLFGEADMTALSVHQKEELRDFYSSHGWCDPRQGFDLARVRPVPVRPPPAPDPVRPPLEEVADVWDRAGPVTADPEVAAWLRGRGLDPARVQDMDVARAIRPDAALPRWARCRGVPWIRGGFRIIVQGWSALGTMESVHARCILKTPPTAPDGSALPKGAWPASGPGSASGLIMANGLALQLLRGQWTEGEPLRVVIAEGVPDFLTWSCCQPDLVIFGVTAGSWKEEHAARLPDGSRVVIWTHADPAGDKYATKVAETFAGRRVELSRGGVWGRDGEPLKGQHQAPLDSNDLWKAGLLPGRAQMSDGPDPFKGARPMEVPPPKRKPAGKPRDLPTMRRAIAAFLERQAWAADHVWFPWPGGQTGLPDDKQQAAAGTVLPPKGGYQGPSWSNLWSKVGPLWPDRVAVLIGATGRGKSAFALQVAEAVARAGHPVLYLSAEMGTDELVARLLALRARERSEDEWGLAWRTVLLGGVPKDDLQAACDALEADCEHLYLWAPRSEVRTAEGLKSMVKGVVETEGGKPPLLIVDYLQRMAEGEDLRGATRSVSRALRDLSRPGELDDDWPGAAVLALSSTGRGNYGYLASCSALKEAWTGGKRRNKDGVSYDVPPIPLEALGKESGEIETDASLLLVLTSNRGDGPKPRNGMMVIPKSRIGGEGIWECTFYPACGRFTERSKAEKSKAPAAREKTKERPALASNWTEID